MDCCGTEDSWNTDFEVDSFTPTYDDSAYDDSTYDTSYNVQQTDEWATSPAQEPLTYGTEADDGYISAASSGDYTDTTQWVSTDGGDFSTDVTVVDPGTTTDAGGGMQWVSTDGGDFSTDVTVVDPGTTTDAGGGMQWMSTDGGDFSNQVMVSTPEMPTDVGGQMQTLSADGGDFQLQVIPSQVVPDFGPSSLDDLYAHVLSEQAAGTVNGGAGSFNPINVGPSLLDASRQGRIVSFDEGISVDNNGVYHDDNGNSATDFLDPSLHNDY